MSTMKTEISAAVVAIVILLEMISGATAQGGNEQRDSIFQLIQNRNKSVITMCPQFSSGGLLCVLENNSLITEDQVYLRNIDITVVTCNSSLSVVFTLSNDMMVRENNLQCPTTIPLGQLMIKFSLNVFTDYSTEMNFTVINTLVYAWQGGQDIEMFARTNLTLDAQIPHEDCIANGGLILPPDIECSTASTTTSPEVTTMTSILMLAQTLALVSP